MNYLQLQTELEKPDYDGLTTSQCATIINEQNDMVSRYVPRQEAINKLLKDGTWDKLEVAKTNLDFPDVVRARIRTFFVALQNIEKLNFENFASDIPNLIGLGIITQENADSFLSLSVVSVSRAETEFGRLLTEADIQIARNQNSIAESQSLLELAGSGYGSVLGLLQGVKTQLEAGEVATVPSKAELVAAFNEALQ